MTFVVTAIVFAVLDLSLSGHGRPSPMQRPFMACGPAQLSVADAVALRLSAVAGTLVMVWRARHR